MLAGDEDNTGIACSMLYSNGTHETNYGIVGGTGFFAVNTWVHMAFSFDWTVGGSVKIYKNGVPQTTYIFGLDPGGIPSVPIPPGTTSNADSSYAWWLGVIDQRAFEGYGVLGDVPDLIWPGLFADFRVYNTVLSDADVAAVYAGGNPQLSSLVTQWKMCANQAGIIDTSGKGNNGAFVGTVPSSLDDPYVALCVSAPPDSHIGISQPVVFWM